LPDRAANAPLRAACFFPQFPSIPSIALTRRQRGFGHLNAQKLRSIDTQFAVENLGEIIMRKGNRGKFGRKAAAQWKPLKITGKVKIGGLAFDNSELAGFEPVIGQVAHEALSHAVIHDDWDAVGAWGDVCSAATGLSIFDMKFERVAVTGEVAPTGNIMQLASWAGSPNVWARLLTAAFNAKHPSAEEMLNHTIRFLEQGSRQHGHDMVVEMLKIYVAPHIAAEAENILADCARGIFPPALTELYRSLCHKHLAEREAKELEVAIPNPTPIHPPRQMSL
jgi:hypothetical protein